MVYVDSVFVLNALMDYLLVLSVGRLAGIPLRRGRYLLAGLLGGAYAVAVFLPGLGFLAATPVKLAAGVLLADAVELPVSEDGSEGSVPPEQPTSSNPIASRSGSSRLQRLRFLVY